MTNAKTDISRHVWETKYRYVDRAFHEQAITDTWRRIARALAAVEQRTQGFGSSSFSPFCKISNSFPVVAFRPALELHAT
jgi:hypothetical protein